MSPKIAFFLECREYIDSSIISPYINIGISICFAWCLQYAAAWKAGSTSKLNLIKRYWLLRYRRSNSRNASRKLLPTVSTCVLTVPFGLPRSWLVLLLFLVGTVFFSRNNSTRTVFFSQFQSKFSKPKGPRHHCDV